MPSGRTHDRITLWSLPVLAGFTYERTHSGELTLIVTSSFLIGGLMFGPDLDINSRQYHRWGILRWIWLPYRKSIRHRSVLSHGPLIGTTVRLLYLSCWVALLSIVIILGMSIVYQLSGRLTDWSVLAKQWLSNTVMFIWRSFQTHPFEFVLCYFGLELGAMSHYLADGGVSAYKRVKTYGIRSLWQSPRGKRKSGYDRASQPPKPPQPPIEFQQLELPLAPPDPPAQPTEIPRRNRKEPQLPQFPPLNRRD
jgi:uncharacterized metal-binding protein